MKRWVRGVLVVRFEEFLGLAMLLGIVVLAWLATDSDPRPSAFGPAPGFWGRMVSGGRRSWLLLAPVLGLSGFLTSRRWEPAVMYPVCGLSAAFVLWSALPWFLSGLVNVLLALLMFVLILPVAFVKGLFL